MTRKEDARIALESIKEKCKFFYERHDEIHISKTNRFYNGVITKITKDYIEIEEFKLGTMILYYTEIGHIEPYDRSGK